MDLPLEKVSKITSASLTNTRVISEHSRYCMIQAIRKVIYVNQIKALDYRLEKHHKSPGQNLTFGHKHDTFEFG